MPIPPRIKFIRTVNIYLEPLYFFTVILASTVAVATFVYTVVSDANQQYQAWLTTWRVSTVRSIILNSEEGKISFQEIKDKYQNRIDREEKVKSINFSSQDVGDDSLRHTLQTLIDQGTLRQTEENEYIVVNKGFNPLQDEANMRTQIIERLREEDESVKIQDAIDDVLIGNPLEYDTATLYIEVDKNYDFDQTRFNRVLTQMRVSGIILDEDGMLFHSFDSVTVPSE